MYDFNPLSSLFLVRSLSTDFPLPSPRTFFAKLKLRRRRPAPTTEYRPVAPSPAKRSRHERAFPWPAHATHPSYNLTPPMPTDVPTHP